MIGGPSIVVGIWVGLELGSWVTNPGQLTFGCRSGSGSKVGDLQSLSRISFNKSISLSLYLTIAHRIGARARDFFSRARVLPQSWCGFGGSTAVSDRKCREPISLSVTDGGVRNRCGCHAGGVVVHMTSASAVKRPYSDCWCEFGDSNRIGDESGLLVGGGSVIIVTSPTPNSE